MTQHRRLGRSLRGWCVVVCAALAVAVAPRVATAETLPDALVKSYLNSNLLEQNRALLRAADEDVAQAIAALRPVLEWAATASFQYNRAAVPRTSRSALLQLTASIVIYDFGRTPLAIKIAKEAVLATRDALVSVEQDVFLTTVQAYMEVIRAARFVDLRRSNVRLITSELRAARERFAVGDSTRTDVSIAQARLAAAQSLLAAAEGDYNFAREAYLAAVGHYPKNLVRPVAPPRAAHTVEEAIAIAVKTHPLIQQRQHEVAISELQIELARANTRPVISGAGSIAADDGSNPVQPNASVSLNIGQTIYQGGALKSAIRQAVANSEAQRAALLQTIVAIQQSVSNAWTSLRVAIARTEASQQQVRASQTAFNGVKAEADLGARTTLDVLDAEQELLDARAALIEAEIQQFVAVYTLLSTMGLLTAEHLGLGLVTYDPEAYYNAVDSAPSHYVSPEGEKLDRLLKTLGK